MRVVVIVKPTATVIQASVIHMPAVIFSYVCMFIYFGSNSIVTLTLANL